MDGPDGAAGVAIRIRQDLAEHPTIQKGMDEVAGFVRSPGIPGILPLVAWDRAQALFVYPLGAGRLLSELIADAASRGIVPGERVAVELVAQVAAVLDAASRRGAPLGVLNHGGLTPWRIVVYPDGDVALLGHALPPVEVIAWLDEQSDELPGPGFRYSPPERIQDDNEDVSSDLYSLGVIAAELALGAPLLVGSAPELVDRILADEASASVAILSEPVRTLLRGILAASRADRRRTGAEVAREARVVLRALSGRTLAGLSRGAWEERVEAVAPSEKPPPRRAATAPPPPPPVRREPAPPPPPADDEPATTTTKGVLVEPMLRVGPFAIGRITIPVPRISSFRKLVDPDEVTTAFERPTPAQAAQMLEDDDSEDDPTAAAPQAEPEPPPAEEPVVDWEYVADDEPAIEEEVTPLEEEPEPIEEEAAPIEIVEDEVEWMADAYRTSNPAPPVVQEPVVPERVAPVEPEPDIDAVDLPIEPTAEEPLTPIPDFGPQVPEVLRLLSVMVDLAESQVVYPDGQLVKLSPSQVSVLAFLAARAGREVSRHDLWQQALGGQGTAESIRGVVTRLRKKIERDAAHPDHLLNVPGVGYRLVLPEGATGPPPLPEPLRSSAGRETELGLVLAGLAEGPLVSIVGPPSSGTSQLALHAARTTAAAGWEVHRCLVGSGEDVPFSLARSLGIRRIGRKPEEIVADLHRVLGVRGDLLVFLDAPRGDPSLREIVGRWLDLHPAARFLVACRGALGLPGEHCVRLEPLGADAAVEMFRSRVAQVRPGTSVDEDVATAIAGHLDRMPVALEAAADRTAFLAPDVLLEKLDRGQDWGEDALDASVATTLEPLDRFERKVLEQCAVFKDGFDLAAAEAVIKLGDNSRAMIGIIESLCARSLLRVVPGGDATNVRWTVYETVRSHLRRTLNPQVVESAQRRHAANYGQLGLRLGGRPWLERSELTVLTREKENLRAVVQHGGVHAAGAALGLTAILGKEDPGPLNELVDRILADPALEAEGALPWRMAARVASARLHQQLGVPSKASGELRALNAELGPSDTLLRAEVARLHTELGSTFEAEAALDKVVSSDPWVLAVVAMLRGRARAARADPKKAERAFIEALHGFAVLEADVGRAHAQRHFAEVLGAVGKNRRAVALLDEALQVFEELGDLPNAIQCRMRLAEILVGLGAGDLATAHLERVMEAAHGGSANGLLALARGVLGVVRTLEHRWDDAESLFFLALAGSAPQHKRIQSLFALHLLLKGDADTAHEEAEGALPDPIAAALLAALERQPAPQDTEAFLLWEALEAWRAAASLTRFEKALADRGSVALRMVLACPRQRPRRAASDRDG